MPIPISTMRTLGCRTNLLFATVAAVGIVAALGRPWYGAAPPDARDRAVGEVRPQLEDLLAWIGRAVSDPSGATGWAAFERADGLLAGLALATVVLLALTQVAALRPHAQALATWTALAALGVCVVKLIDEPGADRMSEPRYGLLVALAAAGVLVASTLSIAAARARRSRAA